jgi:hypothetical protein
MLEVLGKCCCLHVGTVCCMKAAGYIVVDWDEGSAERWFKQCEGTESATCESCLEVRRVEVWERQTPGK